MANPFAGQTEGIRAGQAGADGTKDADQYRISILKRYIAGEGGLKNNVEAYAGAYRPDTAKSAIANYEARSAQRQGLIQGIEDLPDQYGNEVNQLTREAGRAQGEGVSNTRKNFNRRGLLYSGLRESGEQGVKNSVASNLQSGVSGATRDYQNLLNSRKQALAGIELASKQEALNNANAAFEMTTRNNVARAQALQQLGEGVGYAAGSYYGRKSPTPSAGSDGGGGSMNDALSMSNNSYWASNPYSSR